MIYTHIYGHALFDTVRTLVFLCTSDQQKKHKICTGPPNEHSY